MAMRSSSARSAWAAFCVLLCLVGGGEARSLTDETPEFICSNAREGATQSTPCDGQIGDAYATEAFGNPLRRLLVTYYMRSPYRNSPYSSRSSQYGGSSPYGSSRYGSSPYESSPYQGNYGPSSSGSNPYSGSSYGGYPQSSSPSGGFSSRGGGGGAGCSDTDTSVQAVIACTNAVRQNPAAYRYPCSTPWLSEYTRQQRGPFGINGALMNAAQGHSDYQARTGRMTHSGPGGNSVGTRVRQAGYSWRAVAENVAMGQRSAKQVVLDWMCSAGHRRNMMNCRYSDLGVGVTCNGRCFYTQDFGCQGGCGCSGGAPSGSGSPYSGGAPSYGQYGGSPYGSQSGYGQPAASPAASRYSTSNGHPYDTTSTYRPQYEPSHQHTSTSQPIQQSTPSSGSTPWWLSQRTSTPSSQSTPSFVSRSTSTPSSYNSPQNGRASDSSRSSSSHALPTSVMTKFSDFFTFAR